MHCKNGFGGMFLALQAASRYIIFKVREGNGEFLMEFMIRRSDIGSTRVALDMDVFSLALQNVYTNYFPEHLKRSSSVFTSNFERND